MNCLTARRMITTDISNVSNELKQHLSDCSTCKAFYEKQLKFNAVVKKAVEVDVPEGLAARIMVEQQLSQRKENSKKRYSWSAMAASLVLVLTVGIVTTLQAPPAVAGAILEYVHNEADVMHDKKRVTIESLNQLLKPYGIQADKHIGYVTHAGSCMIEGTPAVHVVFAGKNAPITLIVLAEPLERSKTVDISDDVFKGILMDIKKSTVAVVSEDQESLDLFNQQMKSSLMATI